MLFSAYWRKEDKKSQGQRLVKAYNKYYLLKETISVFLFYPILFQIVSIFNTTAAKSNRLKDQVSHSNRIE